MSTPQESEVSFKNVSVSQATSDSSILQFSPMSRLLHCFEFIEVNVDFENMSGTVFAGITIMKMPCESEAGQV